MLFAVLFFLLWKFGFPAVKQAMTTRTERIREDLDAAEKAKTDAESVKDEYERQLAEARSEAARIMEEARQDADAYRNQQRSGRAGDRRDEGALEPTSRPPSARPSRICGPRSPRSRWRPPSRWSSRPSTARPTWPWSSATSTKCPRAATVAEERIEAYASALLTIARSEEHQRAIEDELFAFARSSPTTSCGPRSPTGTCPPPGASRSWKSLSAGRRSTPPWRSCR